MMSLNDILAVLRQIAPESSALPDDPVGLLIGGGNPPVRKAGVCLDATPRIASQAAQDGISLLIAHHPLIYRPLKRVDSERDPIARAVTMLIKADIALYAMHTNWDAAAGGINDSLAATLGLKNIRRLGENGEIALPRLGELPSPMASSDFVRYIEASLGCGGVNAVRFNRIEDGRMISRIGVCGGAGAFLAAEIQNAGADAYVTSDVRHHEFLDATGRGLLLIDAGHGATETPGMRALARHLTEQMREVEIICYEE